MKTIKTLTVAGETYTLAHIDDTQVGDGSWSAKKLIDTLCPVFSMTGKEITCYPVAGYPLDVVSQFLPSQEGIPSLDAPCPIVGRDSLTLTCNGEAVTAQLGKTVYGGSYNWQTGEAVMTWKAETLDGTSSFYKSSYDEMEKCSLFVHVVNEKSVGYDTSYCSHFRNTKNNKPFKPGYEEQGTYTDHPTLNTTYFNWGTKESTAVEFRAWLQEQYDAGMPVVLCYELAEPVTVQVAPEQVLAQAGKNVLTATDSLTVSGRWDLPKFLEGVVG